MSPLTFFLLKDRILATCEANKLEYVNDPTNFQPQFTIRNAIRHCIDSGEGKEPDLEFTHYSAEIATQLKKINNAAAKHEELDNVNLKISLHAGRQHLREAVKKLAKELEEVDATGLSSVVSLTWYKNLICLVQWINFSWRIGGQLLPELSWSRFRHS
jgi:tRNA(Ile)-lysidine synthase TilS/MesJ